MDDDIQVRIDASPPRRVFGLVVLTGLGGLLLYLALALPSPGPVWPAVLVVLSAGILWAAVRMHHVTRAGLELTTTELRDTEGTVLAEVARMERVDRGTFAFKPSNGFLLRLDHRAPMAWKPGLYWRFGRRIGVGGILQAAQTKQMADAIAIMIAERQRPDADR